MSYSIPLDLVEREIVCAALSEAILTLDPLPPFEEGAIRKAAMESIMAELAKAPAKPEWRYLEEEEGADEMDPDFIESKLLVQPSCFEQEMGHSFKSLFTRLPPSLSAVHDWFGNAPRVSEARLRFLLAEFDVRAGGPVAAELAHYDVTPVRLGMLRSVLSDAAHKVWGRHGAGVYDYPLPANSRFAEGSADAAVLTREAAIQALVHGDRKAGNLNRIASACLFDWVTAIAKFVPGIVSGFIAVPSAAGLLLKQRTINASATASTWTGPGPDDPRAPLRGRSMP